MYVESHAIGSVNVSVSSFLQGQSRRVSVSSYGQSRAVSSVNVIGYLFHHNGQSRAISIVKVIGHLFHYLQYQSHRASVSSFAVSKS